MVLEVVARPRVDLNLESREYQILLRPPAIVSVLITR